MNSEHGRSEVHNNYKCSMNLWLISLRLAGSHSAATATSAHALTQLHREVDKKSQDEDNGGMDINIVVLYPVPVVLGVGWDEVIVANLTVVFNQVCCSLHPTCLTEHPPQESQLSLVLP